MRASYRGNLAGHRSVSKQRGRLCVKVCVIFDSPVFRRRIRSSRTGGSGVRIGRCPTRGRASAFAPSWTTSSATRTGRPIGRWSACSRSAPPSSTRSTPSRRRRFPTSSEPLAQASLTKAFSVTLIIGPSRYVRFDLQQSLNQGLA